MQRPGCDVRLDIADTRDFLSPRHVLTGDGSSRRLGRVLSDWGLSPGNGLVVCDPFLVQAGLTTHVIDTLTGEGWKVQTYSAFSAEPTVAVAEDLAELARSLAPSLVVGFGGGTAMDLAKIAALMATNPGPVEAQIGTDKSAFPPLPLALIPTTTGTGAETTRIAMLADNSGKRIISNRMFVPLVAVLDVDLVMGLPFAATASTGMDALSHATESFLSSAATALTASMSLRAIDLLREWLPIAVHDPENKKARRATLYGAFLAGLSLNAGVVVGHSMAYTVANRTRLAHGVTCAMALPFCLAYNANSNFDGSEYLADRLTAGQYSDLRSAAGWLLELNEMLEIPASPQAAGIPSSEIAPMSKECIRMYPRPTNPAPLTAERLLPLYEAWYERDLNAAWPDPVSDAN